MTPRAASDTTERGRTWIEQLQSAQGAVTDAERRRDELVRQAQADGLSVRAIAQALGVDKGTVSRRHPKAQRA